MIVSLRSVIFGVAISGSISFLAVSATTASSGPQSIRIAGFTAISASMRPSTDVDTGEFKSAHMSVEVVLAPRNSAQLPSLLFSLYSAGSPRYHAWLAKGQFNALFAPASAQTAAVATYLRASGLTVSRSSSPFTVRGSGSSSVVANAFKTTLRTYRNPRGTTYFSNSLPAQLPTILSQSVLAVVGLANTVRPHSQVLLPMSHTSSSSPSCQAPYPTRAQLYAAVNDHRPFPFGYGGGPGCSGLTPSQDNAIYAAPKVGPRGQGSGVNLAVFELSAYLRSDIATWAHHFYGPAYSAPLVDIIVDGGPLSPICPFGDICPPDFNGYAGDIEVDADIETQLAISPAASHILVYNASNDYTGQTELDEYTEIAQDDLADVISSSWGICEKDAGASYAQVENLIFEQMAMQGQSMFSAAGDAGAFDCIRSDGSTILNVDDPASQPWVTSVGGTSLETYNPGSDPSPVRPAGIETVWNVDDLCNTSPNEGGPSDPGLFWCAKTGAGGGGNSQYWGRPSYQIGEGVTNPFTTYGNDSTQCSLGAVGSPCREVPDVSLNADEYTPYAEYCTGSSATPFSDCATFSGGQTPAGWFGIGGTSVSSPFWSAIIADRDSYQLSRTGNANPTLYALFNRDFHRYFYDPTGVDQGTKNNGFFPTTRGYDIAIGIGTPIMNAIITATPPK